MQSFFSECRHEHGAIRSSRNSESASHYDFFYVHPVFKKPRPTATERSENSRSEYSRKRRLLRVDSAGYLGRKGKTVHERGSCAGKLVNYRSRDQFVKIKYLQLKTTKQRFVTITNE